MLSNVNFFELVWFGNDVNGQTFVTIIIQHLLLAQGKNGRIIK